ncbi:O-antigen ligase family protein, partial [bacterium]|nr:O-antigen ligase family protein [candidate division CSSED10-310 bacterium]
RLRIVLLLIALAGGIAAFAHQHDRITVSQSFRLETWRTAARAAAAAPLFGHGPGRFPVVFSQYRAPDYLRHFRHAMNLRHAHQEYLEILCETGVVGLGLAAFVLLVALFHRAAARHSDPSGAAALVPLEAALLAVLTHNLVSVNLRDATVHLVFWFSLGIVTAGARRRADRPGDRLAAAGCLVILVILGMTTTIEARRFRSERLRAKAAGAADTVTGHETAINLLRQAVRRDPGNLFAAYDLGAELYGAGRFGEAADTYLAMVRIDPFHQQAPMNLAQSLYMAGHPGEAADWAKRALLHEDTEVNRYSLALFLDQAGDQGAAAAYAEAYRLSAAYEREYDARRRPAGRGMRQVTPREQSTIHDIQAMALLRFASLEAASELHAGDKAATLIETRLDELAVEQPDAFTINAARYAAYLVLDRGDLIDLLLDSMQAEERRLFLDYVAAVCGRAGDTRCAGDARRRLNRNA